MATNSKREQIIVYHKIQLEALSWANTVSRSVPKYDELKNFSSVQFPVIAIGSELPIPNEKWSSRTKPGMDKSWSDMKINNYIYLHANEYPDTLLSNRADDMWTKLWSMDNYGGLIKDLSVQFDPMIVYLAPYLEFKIISTITYEHTTGGI